MIVAVPLLVLLLRRHQPPLPAVHAAAEGGRRRRPPRGEPTNQVLLGSRRSTSPPRARSGTRSRSARPADPGAARSRPHTDPGIRARWWDFAQEEPRLEILETEEGRTQALLEEVWRLPRGESDFVTVVVPEQFKRQSLLSAAGRTRSAQAPAPLGARCRGHRRAGRDAASAARAPHPEAPRGTRSPRERARGSDALAQLCRGARTRGRPCGLVRLRRR